MIYVLEDDNNIRDLVVYTLNTTGLNAVGFGLPSLFWEAVKKEAPELVLLDIMLPEEDGLSVLKRLKANRIYTDIPVIMVSAKGAEFDKVTGLNAGADDYIAKPFGMMELIARVKAALRRNAKKNAMDYTLGELYVCPDRHEVKVAGENAELTLKEFELLCLLLKNKDNVISRDTLLGKLWGYGYDGENRTVDVHIHSLRGKLGKAGEHIKTVRGLGYKISE